MSRPAGDVNQPGAGLDHVSVSDEDHVLGVGREGRREDDEVGLGEQLGEAVRTEHPVEHGFDQR